jgi:hypothetical protein
MAANSAAHPLKAGFNQSGGAYFMCLQALDNTNINKISNASTGSGGAVLPPTFALVAATDASIGLRTSDLAANKLIKDMGKSVVSAGRTFRKFAAVVNTGAASTMGVYGAPGSAPNTGYGSFYLEVGREGAAGGAPAPIARYF